VCPQQQQHSFNCPFQLASHELRPEADAPEDADLYEVELMPGDILVVGSDGLFDNMWDDQLESIVAEHMKVRHAHDRLEGALAVFWPCIPCFRGCKFWSRYRLETVRQHWALAQVLGIRRRLGRCGGM
jgi:hypothetical protein